MIVEIRNHTKHPVTVTIVVTPPPAENYPVLDVARGTLLLFLTADQAEAEANRDSMFMENGEMAAQVTVEPGQEHVEKGVPLTKDATSFIGKGLVGMAHKLVQIGDSAERARLIMTAGVAQSMPVGGATVITVSKYKC